MAMTSATVTTNVVGDVQNSQGFKDASGTKLVGGDVVWTAYTTNDTTTPAASSLLTLSGRDFLSFQNLIMFGGNASPSVINAQTNSSTDITLQDCYLVYGAPTQSGTMVDAFGAASVALNWTVNRCILVGCRLAGLRFRGTLQGTADYSLNCVVQNCLFIHVSIGVWMDSAAASGANKPGGVTVYNCTNIAGTMMEVDTTGYSTSVPCNVYNSIICHGTATGLIANTTGQIVENYNYFYGGTARSNVSIGQNSVVGPTFAHMLEFGQSAFALRQMRAFTTPMYNSPLLGFSNYGGGPGVDLLYRTRPSGGYSYQYSVGALERHDFGAKNIAVMDTGAACLQQLGAGDDEFLVPVDAVLTTISVNLNTSGYGGTNFPQIVLWANTEIGVAGQTVTASSAPTVYTTLTLASFTPTAKGFVRVRLINRTSTNAGTCFWDTFRVS